MKKITTILLSIAAATTCHAAVTLDFTGTGNLEGFVTAGFGDSPNTSVAWSADNGGSMLLSNDRGGFGTIVKFFTNAGQGGKKTLFYNELVLAYTNGGTITYDVITTASSITGATGPGPTFAQVGFFADNQSGSFDTQSNAPALTTPVVVGTTPYSIAIQTTGAKVNNDSMAYFLGGTGNLQFGFTSNYNNATGLSFYIDNITVTAIPEPSSMALLGLGGLLLVRRKRS